MSHSISIQEVNKAEAIADVAARIAMAAIIAAGFIACLVAL